MSRQQQIAELEQQIELSLAKVKELRATPDALIDKHGRYLSEPAIGTKCFAVISDGSVSGWEWCTNDIGVRILLQGNLFATREQAEVECKRRELTQRAKLFMAKDRAATGFEPSFNCVESPQTSISIHQGLLFTSQPFSDYQFLTLSSDEVYDQFRKEFSDDEIMLILDRG